MNGKRLILWILTIAMAAVIFAFSQQSGEASSAASTKVAEIVISVIDPEFDALSAEEQSGVFLFVKKLVRKGAHFAEFAALGFLIRLLWHSYGLKWGSRVSWLIGTLYACTDELHQMFVSARAAMWQDVLLDSAGVAAGIMAAHTLLVLLLRIRRARENEKMA